LADRGGKGSAQLERPVHLKVRKSLVVSVVDDLQDTMSLLRGSDLEVDLQFTNFR
jgi:uncharacterized protein YajQ (UPF0234 family)